MTRKTTQQQARRCARGTKAVVLAAAAARVANFDLMMMSQGPAPEAAAPVALSAR